MPILLILAGSLLTPPELVQANFANEYPRQHLRAGHSAAVLMELRVGKDGKVTSCKVLEFDGNRDLSEETCKITRRRVRFEAARDSTGDPSISVVIDFVKMVVPGTEEGDRIAKLTASPEVVHVVKSLPEQYSGYLDFHVGLQIDTDGNVTECNVRDDGVEATYAEIACNEAFGRKFGIVSEDEKTPIPYVRRLKVRFETAIVELTE